MAIYPVLFLQYIRFFAPGLGGVEGWLIALVLIWGATWLNLRGTRAVGTASGWLIAAVLAPFALLAVVALGRWVFGPAAGAAPFRPFAAPGPAFFGALGVGVFQSIWNYNGWGNAPTGGGGVAAALVRRPPRGRRAARHGGAGARVRGAVAASQPRAGAARRVPGAGRAAGARGPRPAAGAVARHRGDARGAEPRDRVTRRRRRGAARRGGAARLRGAAARAAQVRGVRLSFSSTRAAFPPPCGCAERPAM